MHNDSWVGAVIAVALVVGLAAGFALGINIEARQRLFLGPTPEVVEAPEPHDPCADGTWRVSRGDTPWDIAKACFPGGHTGSIASEITRINGVDAGALQVGMTLRLPERGRR